MTTNELILNKNRKIIENIVKLQSIEDIEVTECVQVKMLEILDGTKNIDELVNECLAKYTRY